MGFPIESHPSRFTQSSDVISALTLKCFWRARNRATREIYLQVTPGPRDGNIEVIRERAGPEPQAVLNKDQKLMLHVKELIWGKVRVLGEGVKTMKALPKRAPELT